MNRRELMLLLFLLALAVPTGAQSAGEKLYRLGQLALTAESIEVTRSTTLPELAKLGFIEGRNLVLDERAGDRASMPRLARSLVLGKPDAIIAIGIDAIRAASEATGTIPLLLLVPMWCMRDWQQASLAPAATSLASRYSRRRWMVSGWTCCARRCRQRAG